MAISKIKGGAINDDAISTAKIVDDAVTDAKIVDSYTTSVKTNPEFQGTEAARMPVGTTAERANAQGGDIRFNSTLSLMEYYDGTIWKAIDSPPVVSSISPTSESDGSANITITGSNFQSGATVQFIGNDGTVYNSPSVTVNSSTEVVATTPSTPLSVANEPYDIKLTNTSGLAGTLADALDAGGVPAWNTAAGTIGTIYDASKGSVSLSVSATDPDGDTITYAVASGSLPSGLSLNSSTGAITGSTSSVGSDTTSTFDISATTASNDTVSRTFNIIQKAPVVQSFTSVGSGTFSVPSGVTAVDVLVVAGGGSGCKVHGGTVSGGGGAGGLIYRPAFPVTPGSSVSYTVGDGVLHPNYNAPSATEYNPGPSGQNSVFGSLTAIGGAGGTGSNDGAVSGGSGGGGGAGGGGPGPGGTGTQPQQPGDSGTYGFGNPGGSSSNDARYGGGGGGGAGAAGQSGTQTPSSQAGGDGGIGKQYDISGSQVYYAGGGAGNSEPTYGTQGVGGQGGGGNSSWGGTAGAGVANRGGGSGTTNQAGVGAKGGSGIVIVKY